MISNMTTGSPAGQIIRFSIPLLIGNVLQQIYFMTDMAIVSRTINPHAMAAVGATGAIGFLIFGFYFGLTNGFAVITAQRFGAQDFNGVRRSFVVSIELGIITTIAGTMLSLPIADALLKLMHTPADIHDNAVIYLTTFFYGTGAIVFYNLLACCIRALGDSWTPLCFLAFATVLNIVLDYIFILVFDMGIAGAAWATIASQVISVLLCFVYMYRFFPMLRPKWRDWKFDPAWAWQHLRIALPMGFQFSVTAIGVMVMQQQINEFGTVTVTAFTVGTRIEQLAVQPMFTIGIAIATFAAQNYGAKQFNRIRRGVFQASLICTIWCVISGAALIVFSRALVGIFLDTEAMPSVTEQAQYYICIVSTLFIVLAQLFIFRNVLQGVGHSFIPFMAGVIELIIRIAASIALAPRFGYSGVFWATPAAWIGATVLLACAYFWVFRGKEFREDAGLGRKKGELGIEL
ncbi:MAG: MATE family efflux transporter [Victivallales bacterium]|jgi:putative MATE family efflux protein|nr:MATE family efflux transporter [Victivallales bacterium]